MPNGQKSVYFDLKVSNDTYNTVSIRHVSGDTWAYEIWTHSLARKIPNHRGTLDWKPNDMDHPEYLYLASKVLGNYYADLSEQGIWQEPTKEL